MSPADILGRPEGWPWLAAAPLAWWALSALDRRRERRLADWVGPRVATLVPGRDPRGRARRRVLFAAGLLAALVAMLRPAWGEGQGTVERRGVDLVVCLDVSRSMEARDVAPDRLTRARREVAALCECAVGDRLALVVFAGEARVAVPLTRDARSVAEMADLLGPDSGLRGGTDLGAALEAALSLLGGAASGEHEAILLLTDGEDLGERGLRVAGTCRERGIAVHAVGFGTALGGKIAVAGPGGEAFLRDASGVDVVSRMDEAGLRRIAEAAGGAYADGAGAPGALVRLYDDRVAPMATRAYEAERRARREERFQWPLLAALLLFLAETALPPRRRPA